MSIWTIRSLPVGGSDAHAFEVAAVWGWGRAGREPPTRLWSPNRASGPGLPTPRPPALRGQLVRRQGPGRIRATTAPPL